MRFLIATILFVPVSALAACLNPFGCDPTTQTECVKDAAKARTESAAKAMIAECRKLPRVSLGQCESAEKQWAQHLKSHNGSEWDWPDYYVKDDCKKIFPKTFSSRLWVTPSYCQENAVRLKKAETEVNLVNKKSLILERIRRDVPALIELDDRQAIDFIQARYYQNASTAAIAASVFLDAPPEPLSVVELCKKIQP